MSIIQHLIDKYYHMQLPCVYRLSYGGKYVIVKGKTLAGSLFFIQKGYGWFDVVEKKDSALYGHFYTHIKETTAGRFRVRVLLKTANTYALLKREQNELDKGRYDQNCLNNNTEGYIPQYNEQTGLYGWLDKGSVLNFKNYLKSKARKVQLDSYKKSQQKAQPMSAS